MARLDPNRPAKIEADGGSAPVLRSDQRAFGVVGAGLGACAGPNFPPDFFFGWMTPCATGAGCPDGGGAFRLAVGSESEQPSRMRADARLAIA